MCAQALHLWVLVARITRTKIKMDMHMKAVQVCLFCKPIIFRISKGDAYHE